MATGYKMYAGLKGSKEKTVGSDADIYQYTNLETCLADAQPNDVIKIYDGTYSLTAIATINYNLTMIGYGNVTINGGTSGLSNRLIMLNKPAAGTAATTITFRNINFANAASSADVFEIDNDGGGTGALNINFEFCSFDAGTSGLSFDIDQTTNTIDLQVKILSMLGYRKTIEGCNFALSKAGSEVVVEGYDFGAAVIALGTADVASVYTLIQCQYESAAFMTGGAASIIVNAQSCSKVSSAALVAPVIEDFDQTAASENIQSGVLDT